MKLAQVYDLNGKLIQKSDVINGLISVETLSAGTYIIMLRDQNGKDYAQKFLKQ